jgi:hypothetical protein
MTQNDEARQRWTAQQKALNALLDYDEAVRDGMLFEPDLAKILWAGLSPRKLDEIAITLEYLPRTIREAKAMYEE